MDYKDYYKILGITKGASQDEIKKAYRKLAVKYHPDKNSGDKTAEAKFKEINEANEVLSNPEKRKLYDELGSDWKNYQRGGGKQDGFDWGKYQQQYGGGNQYSGGQSYYDFGDVGGSFGGSQGGFSDFFEAFFGGQGFSGARQRGSKMVHKGEDIHAELPVTLEEAYKGAEKLFEINGQTIKLRVKKGVADGQILKLAGKGYPGSKGGANGDLMITIKVSKHPIFNRIDDDLNMDLPLDIYTAVLGGKIDITAFKGKTKITIPPETSNGKIFRLNGLGMPKYGKENQYGDLYVKVDLQTPKNLTKEEIKLFKELAELRAKQS